MNPAEWDDRYGGAELVWGTDPNRWVRELLDGVPPGRAVDLGCGEGRNALWLARHRWQVLGVDFSAVGLDRARALAAQQATAERVRWERADVTDLTLGPDFDLVLLAYLQLPAAPRRQAVRRACAALAPGGALLVIGHDSSNLTDGVGGPQDARVLFTPADVVADATDADPALVVEIAEVRQRPVDGAPRPARDAVVRIRRAAGGRSG